MRILTKRKLKRLEEVIACAYVQNIREGKNIDDCIAMNDKLARIAKLTLGKRAEAIPDNAHAMLRRLHNAKQEA